MSLDKENVQIVTRVNKRTYKITKRPVIVRDKRLATMDIHYLYKHDFLSVADIRTDFICDKCEGEIIGNHVYLTLTDVEVHSLIKGKKPLLHKECIQYLADEPHLGILSLREDRLNLEMKGREERKKQAELLKALEDDEDEESDESDEEKVSESDEPSKSNEPPKKRTRKTKKAKKKV